METPVKPKTEIKEDKKAKTKGASAKPLDENEEYKQIGEEIIKVFHLKADKDTGFVQTLWGTKSAIGLGKTIERIIKGVKKGEKYSPEND